jgi:beta-lactamase regulating signal transducer with metallopeptidase domain
MRLEDIPMILMLLLDWIAKGFVVLGLTFLADLLLRRASASLRHSIWLAGLGAVMLLPAMSRVLPRLEVPLLRLDSLFGNSAPVAASDPTANGAGLSWSAAEFLFGVYCAGALLVFAWQLIGRLYAFRLRARATRITHGRLNRELVRLKDALGIRNPVELLASHQISIPFSTGYLRPVIVLPPVASTWPAPVLESVLTHELAHIKRKDILSRIAVQISCCVHWINPLAWYGFGRVMMEQEIACDNLVLSTGTKASDYARNLLLLSEVRHGRLDFALTALGRRTELKNRLLEILQPTRTRAPLPVGGSMIFLMVTFILIMPVSALNIWDGSDSVMLRNPLDRVNRGPMPSSPGFTGNPLPPAPASIPDIGKAKEGISKKIQDMKAQGVSQDVISKFTREAKAKLETLQREKLKQDEKNRQKERVKGSEGKKIE